MITGATAWRLADGRLHLQHGPIDLLISVSGDDASRARNQAVAAFDDVLATLVNELGVLRAPLSVNARCDIAAGSVARRMIAAARPWATRFVTPMAAVAGAVADHVLGAMRVGTELERAAVNNGGDIALHLDAGHRYDIAICTDPGTRASGGRIALRARNGIGGIATSGWRGRSHSFGIADAVTVLARSAAMADVAATLIANAVDLPGSTRVRRAVAHELDPDTDLADRSVTVEVAELSMAERARALDAALPLATEAVATGLATAVFLSLQGEYRTVGATRLVESLRVPDDASV